MRFLSSFFLFLLVSSFLFASASPAHEHCSNDDGCVTGGVPEQSAAASHGDDSHQSIRHHVGHSHPHPPKKHQGTESLSGAMHRTDCPAPQFPNYTYCAATMPTASNYEVPVGFTLRNVQLVSRHGDRTPASVMPGGDNANYNLCNKPATTGFHYLSRQHTSKHVHTPAASNEGRRLYKNPTIVPVSPASPFTASYWAGNCMTGQLTDVGIAQLETLGQNLRNIYVNKLGFLPGVYSPQNTSFYLRTTDIWRTQQSAESLLSALWPSSSLSDSPIPFHVYPIEIETMFANSAACPALVSLMSSRSQSAEWKAHLNQPALWPILEAAFGTANKPEWHQAFDNYFDQMSVRTCHNMPLPCSPDGATCVDQNSYQQVVSLANWEFAYAYTQYEWQNFATLGIGGFVSVLRDVWVAIANDNPSLSSVGTPDFAFYSGHDTTLTAVLGAFNVTNWPWPAYASNMLFELWEKDTKTTHELEQASVYDNLYVRFIYNGEVISLASQGCCDELCPLENVVTYLNNLIPSNLPDLCKTNKKAL